MSHYLMIEWIAFFFLYCFGGWCFESIYVSLRTRRLVNRGFMRGPFIPLYGSGAVMMLLVSMPFREHWLWVYISGCVGATALELITGLLMEGVFKVRYWDYSNVKGNFKGLICWKTTLAWGALTVALTSFLHKGTESLVLSLPHAFLTGMVYLVSIYFIVDFTLSFKAALDIKDVLVGLDRIRAEMEHMQKRLDALIGSLNEKIGKRVSVRSRGDLLDGIEERFSKVKELILKYPTAFMGEVKYELLDMLGRFHFVKARRIQLKNMRDFFLKGMIRGNPGMHSEKFKEALEELKESIQNRIGRDKND